MTSFKQNWWCDICFLLSLRTLSRNCMTIGTAVCWTGCVGNSFSMYCVCIDENLPDLYEIHLVQ